MALNEAQLKVAKTHLLKLYFVYLEKTYPQIWEAALAKCDQAFRDSLKSLQGDELIQAADRIYGSLHDVTDGITQGTKLAKSITILRSVQKHEKFIHGTTFGFEEDNSAFFIDWNAGEQEGSEYVKGFFKSMLPANQIFDDGAHRSKLQQVKAKHPNENRVPYVVSSTDYDAISKIKVDAYQASFAPAPVAAAINPLREREIPVEVEEKKVNNLVGHEVNLPLIFEEVFGEEKAGLGFDLFADYIKARIVQTKATTLNNHRATVARIQQDDGFYVVSPNLSINDVEGDALTRQVQTINDRAGKVGIGNKTYLYINNKARHWDLLENGDPRKLISTSGENLACGCYTILKILAAKKYNDAELNDVLSPLVTSKNLTADEAKNIKKALLQDHAKNNLGLNAATARKFVAALIASTIPQGEHKGPDQITIDKRRNAVRYVLKPNNELESEHMEYALEALNINFIDLTALRDLTEEKNQESLNALHAVIINGLAGAGGNSDENRALRAREDLEDLMRFLNDRGVSEAQKLAISEKITKYQIDVRAHLRDQEAKHDRDVEPTARFEDPRPRAGAPRTKVPEEPSIELAKLRKPEKKEVVEPAAAEAELPRAKPELPKPAKPAVKKEIAAARAVAYVEMPEVKEELPNPPRYEEEKRREAKAAPRAAARAVAEEELARLARPEEKANENLQVFVKGLVDDEDYRQAFLSGKNNFIQELNQPKAAPAPQEPQDQCANSGVEFLSEAGSDNLSLITAAHEFRVNRFQSRSLADNQRLRKFAQDNATGPAARRFDNNSKTDIFPSGSPLDRLNNGDDNAIEGCTNIELEAMKEGARVYYDESALDENQVDDILKIKSGQKPAAKLSDANLVTMTIPSKILLDNRGNKRAQPLPVVFTNFTYPKFNEAENRNLVCFSGNNLKPEIVQNVKKMIALNIAAVNAESARQGIKLPFILNIPGAFISRLNENQINEVKNCIALALREGMRDCPTDNIDSFIVLGGKEFWRNQADIRNLSSAGKIHVVNSDMVDIAEKFNIATNGHGLCPLPLMVDPLGPIGNGALSPMAESAADEFFFRASGGLDGLVGSLHYNPDIEINKISSKKPAKSLDALKDQYAALPLNQRAQVAGEFEKQYKIALLEKCRQKGVNQDLAREVVDCDFDDLNDLNANIDDDIARNAPDEKKEKKEDKEMEGKSELVQYFIRKRRELWDRANVLDGYLETRFGNVRNDARNYHYVKYDNEKSLQKELNAISRDRNSRNLSCTPFLKCGDNYQLGIKDGTDTIKISLNQGQVDAIVNQAQADPDNEKSLDRKIIDVVKRECRSPEMSSFFKGSTIIKESEGKKFVYFISDAQGEFQNQHIYLDLLPGSNKRVRIDVANFRREIAIGKETYFRGDAAGKNITGAIMQGAGLVLSPLIPAAIPLLAAGAVFPPLMPVVLPLAGAAALAVPLISRGNSLAPGKVIKHKNQMFEKGDLVIHGILEDENGKEFTSNELSLAEKRSLEHFMKNLVVASYSYNEKELEPKVKFAPSSSPSKVQARKLAGRRNVEVKGGDVKDGNDDGSYLI